MPARVINLSQLAPEDVILDLGNGVRYTIPGATAAITIIELSRIYDDLIRTQRAIVEATDDESKNELAERQIDLIEECDAALLELLHVRQPDLKATGFSSEQLGTVLGGIISGFRELAGEEDDPPPTPSRASRRAPRSATSRTRSKRSNGSASS